MGWTLGLFTQRSAQESSLEPVVNRSLAIVYCIMSSHYGTKYLWTCQDLFLTPKSTSVHRVYVNYYCCYYFCWSPFCLLSLSMLSFYGIRRISIPWWPWMEQQSFKWYHSKHPRLDSFVVWTLKKVKGCRYCSPISLSMYFYVVFYGAWFHYVTALNIFSRNFIVV